MIVLRLVLPPDESKTLSLADTATLRDLRDRVRSSFGLTAGLCFVLRFGYPPRRLNITQHNGGDSLAAAGIRNQDRVEVVVVPNKENNTNTNQHTKNNNNANQKANNVVDLLDDSSSSEDESANTAKKRPAVARTQSSSTIRKTKTARIDHNNNDNATTTTEAPVYLFAVEADEALRRNAPPTHPCFTQCKTLPEMVFGNSNDGNASNVRWMALANFLVGYDYLLDKLPQLLTVPTMVVFQPDRVPVPASWPGTNQEIDFVPLDPSAEPRTRANPLKHRFEYGCHHTKLFLVGYEDKIRVVVSTGNLRYGDATLKANAAYVEEFPLKKKTGAEDQATTSDFEETLVHYVRSYGYGKHRNWLDRPESLLRVIQRYDYSRARAVLIPSVPGYHEIDNKTPRMGQLKLRQAIRRYAAPRKRQRTVVCQFSSIGTLSEPYLHTLQTSMDACLAKDDRQGGSLRLKLVYPTVEEIRSSIEGYSGGGSVPGRKGSVGKKILKPMWYKWGSSSSTTGNPLAKPDHVPHIKSYYQTDGENGFDWLVVASHNISQSAWGTIRRNKKRGGQHLYVRSWELGVFLSPQTLGVKKLVPFSGEPARPDAATVPVPYATHALERHGPNDRPWAVDEVYQRPDALGRRSCKG